MGDEELIQILNGLVRDEKQRGSNSIHMYYNDQGNPTDDFLEALKVDSNKEYSIKQSNIHGDIYDCSDENDSENNNYNDENIQQSSNYIKKSSRRSSVSSNKMNDEDTMYNYYEALPRKGSKQRKKHSKSKSIIHEKTEKAEKVTTTDDPKRYMQPIKVADRVYSGSSTTKGVNPLSNSSTLKIPIPSNEPTITMVQSDEQIAVLESKILKMKLRLQGQQSTIRALENKLAECTVELQGKTVEITNLVKRIRTQEGKESSTRALAQLKPAAAADGKKNDEMLRQLKSANETLKEKLNDEVARTKRAEERAKEMREYAEKNKVSLSALEFKVTDQTTLIDQLQSKLSQYRKEGRDVNAKVAYALATSEEKAMELGAMKSKLELFEGKLKECSTERDKYKASNLKLRSELVTVTEKASQLKLEVNVLREKERSKKSLAKYDQREDISSHPSKDVKGMRSRAEDTFDWSKFDSSSDGKEARKVRSLSSVDKRVRQSSRSESKDDNSIRSKKPLTIWDTDSASLSDSFKTKNRRSLSELIEKDVSAVMKSLQKNNKSYDKSDGDVTMTTKGSTTSRAAEARKRFDRLNAMYKRVSGDTKDRSAANDSASDDSSV